MSLCIEGVTGVIHVLIVDDDKNLLRVLTKELSDDGFDVIGTENGMKASDLLEKNDYDVLLLDLNLPGLGGMDLLKKIKTLAIPLEVIILTGHATVSTAVEAMKLGAYDYLTKPFQVEELKVVIEKAYEKKELLQENLHLKTQIKRQSKDQRILTKNPIFLGILEQVTKISRTDLSILICGESGVGKELVAKAIHEESNRGNGPFIPLNCGAIPDNLLESELFGYEKGAFTGAHVRKPGLLEVAYHGTLFWDEIGELPFQLQTKLLRVIETGIFFRVGGIREVKVDVRFIAATNREIKEEVEKGRFREDLYYRISAISLLIPPLRERKEDISLLVEDMIQNNPAFKRKSFNREALKILTDYRWPGNVRELQNVVHRTLLLSTKDVIEPEDLPVDLIETPKVSGSRLEDVEREHIIKVLKEAGGQKGKAAEILGVDPKTLYRKLLNYRMDEE
jgi:DNA-binding NtrC family response regulator